MKRLFEVKGHFFSNKEEAKTFRDELNNQGGKAHVSKGPDHIRYNPNPIPTPKKNKRKA